MSDKDWFDDYMDYKLSGSEGDEKSSESPGCFPWILGVIVLLGIISKLFG